jgi:GNAT superfamily N-acetyltransferase
MKIEYRHPSQGDIDAIALIINRGSADLKHHTERTPEDIRTWMFGDKDFNAEGYLLTLIDGQAVAYGGSTIVKSRQESGMRDAYFELFMLSEWREKGIEDHIINSTLEFLRARGISSLKFYAPEKTGWRNDFAARSRMMDIRHGYTMIYDRKEFPSEAPVPDNYSFNHTFIESSTDDDIRDFVNTFNQSFIDHWNFSPMPPDRLLKVRDEVSKKKDSMIRFTIAKKGNESTGICFCEISYDYNKQKNKKTGFVNILGVRKPHRRLGLGRALLSNTMAWLWEQGMDTIILGMDAENSKALGLYTSQGFKIEREGVTYELKV